MAARQEEQPVFIDAGELPAPLVFLLLLVSFQITGDIKKSRLDRCDNKKAWIDNSTISLISPYLIL